ncbi:MAG: DNA-3-methyladenine glycosylase [Cyclobacteriaceae bacterium]
MKLDNSFYRNEEVTDVAKNLLGKVLYADINDVVCAGRIVETEAYSFREKACHAYGNRFTARTETLFAEGGTAYVYLCYGIHRLFNIVTNQEGVAEAVLIRALEPIQGINHMRGRRNKSSLTALTSGPGKLAQAMGIDLEHDKISLTGPDIWLENDNFSLSEPEIISGPRIGVDYAGDDALLFSEFTQSIKLTRSHG